MSEENSIAVIGAGPMGLAVAHYLQEAGKKVVVYEADDRVGGMTASFDFDGTRIERYYHFICANDTPHFEMINKMGLDDRLKWTNTEMGYYYEGALYDWGNPLALLKFPKLDFISKMRYGLHAFYSTKRSDWSGLDKLEASTWIKKWIGERAYDVLWKSLFDLKFYEYANQLSAAWIWTRIKRIGTSRYSLMKEKLGYLEGGSEVLLKAMQQDIERRGGKVRLSSAVQKVEVEGNRTIGVVVEGELVRHETVISTTPIPYITKLIPDLSTEMKAQFEALPNIAVVCLIVKLKKPVTKNFWLNINDERMDIPGLVEYSNLNAGKLGEHIVYVPYYMPGEHPKYQDSDDVFKQKVRNYIRTINPDIQECDFIAIHASRYRFAQPVCEPQFLDKLPDVKLPVRGLYVADTSYYYPEDRGVSEGIRFAKEIVEKVLN